MEIKVTSLSIKEMINLKADNENLKNVVTKLQADYFSAKEESMKNYKVAQGKTSEIIVLKREHENLKLKYEELNNANRFNLGKCEAYEEVIKQLIGGQ